MLTVLTVLRAKETELDVSKHQNFLEMQVVLMHAFFGNFDESTRLSLMNDDLESPVCGISGSEPWNGVACIDGIVRGIWYASLHIGNFSIAYLPGTVKHIWIA